MNKIKYLEIEKIKNKLNKYEPTKHHKKLANH